MLIFISCLGKLKMCIFWGGKISVKIQYQTIPKIVDELIKKYVKLLLSIWI